MTFFNYKFWGDLIMLQKNLLVGLLILLSIFAFGCANNPVTGRNEISIIGEDRDVEIGVNYSKQLETQLGGRIQDPQLQNYIDTVGQKIALVCHRPYLKYRYVACNDKVVNAYALPGGFVYITKGMLKNLTSEAQLAAILAHQTAHISSRDVVELMGNDMSIKLTSTFVLSEKTSQAVLTAGQVSNKVIGYSFNPKDEHIADLAAMDYMYMAGYNPNAMIEIIEKMQKDNQLLPVVFMLKHPGPSNRLEYMKERTLIRYKNLDTLTTGQQQYKTQVLDKIN